VATELGAGFNARDNRPMDDSRAHWQRVYVERDSEEVSWYELVPETSLQLIQEAALPLDAAILDVGGGASKLAGHLVAAGYTDVTVADISRAALERARVHSGAAGNQITWIEADVRYHHFTHRFDLWHDRAMFHFMVDRADQNRYLTALARTLRPDGHLIIATFGPNGPTRCSGLPVARYGSDELSSILGEGFELISSRHKEHRTPGGHSQEFVYAHLRGKGKTP
jgi:SAM-dependent methyltransferase